MFCLIYNNRYELLQFDVAHINAKTKMKEIIFKEYIGNLKNKLYSKLIK